MNDPTLQAPPKIVTFSGTLFDIIEPDLSEFTIVDIAHALSHICRFVGHTRKFYSVAQHSVLVSKNVPEAYALEGLLHDASEAFLGDVAKPLKNILPEYRGIEKAVEKAIAKKFGLSFPFHSSIKIADLRAVTTETRDVMPDNEQWEHLEGIEMFDEIIQPVSCVEAKEMFLVRFGELTR